MRVFYVWLLVVGISVTVLGKPKKRRKVQQGPEEPKVKARWNADGKKVNNWHDGRKVWMDDCVDKKKGYFTDVKGRVKSLSFLELTKVFVEEMDLSEGGLKKDSRVKNGHVKPQTTTTTTTTTLPKGKKARAKLELLQKMGGQINTKNIPENTKTLESATKQQMESMSMQTLQHIVKRTKLPPDHQYTAREFCDIMWRIQNPSPLDNEVEQAQRNYDPFKEMDDTGQDWWDEDKEEDSEVNIDDVEL